MYFLGLANMWEWILIGVAVLLLFGGSRKIPDLARALGSSVTEFKRGLKGGSAELPDGSSGGGAGGAGENKDRQ